MKVVAVATQKGGQGKTTIALHLAFSAVEAGLKVLFVDLDTQGNATLILTGSSRIAHTPDYTALTASSLFNAQTGRRIKPLATDEGIDLIAPDAQLSEHIKGTIDPHSPELAAPRTVLGKFADDYDLCIIDAPPALGQVLAALLAASNAVITPLTMDIFAIDGAAELLDTISLVKEAENPGLVHLGIVPNQINTRSQDEIATLVSLRQAYGSLITPYAFSLRYAVKAAISARKPVWRSVNGSSHRKAAQEWKDNCRTVLEQLNVLESQQ
ncbi:chromosome partitioning protein [Nitrosomonas eutropha]|uniref:Chromosome partitioning protein n=1 Tax=Nitrosomonas eutropha TaxID=916 RepID=A0A1I7FCD1_9PROT|nr:ParA family protein [Nitrosomonas eutropha]SFU33824.1 chromosome partitioning protein [Nitrosomonas eutropha]